MLQCKVFNFHILHHDCWFYTRPVRDVASLRGHMKIAHPENDMNGGLKGLMVVSRIRYISSRVKAEIPHLRSLGTKSELEKMKCK